MESPLLQAVLLAVVQGMTEFLPVSSSGHLVIAQQLLPGFKQPGILFDVLLHVGTLISVIVYFRQDLWAMFKTFRLEPDPGKGVEPVSLSAKNNRRLLEGIIIATVVTVPVGLVIEPLSETLFSSVRTVGAMLLVTAGLLYAAHWRMRPQDEPRGRAGLLGAPGRAQSLLIGLAQGVAVIPGISRSGATITAGILAGVEGVSAARFSFLISLPAVSMAAAYELIKEWKVLSAFSAQQALAYVLGLLVAAVVGYLCIALVIKVVRQNLLLAFAIYCTVAGTGAIIWGGAG